MAYRYVHVAPYRQESREGLTIAIAILIRVEGVESPDRPEFEQLGTRIDELIASQFKVNERAPIGVSIRTSDRDGKHIPANLVLDAAVGCPTAFELSGIARPVRTITIFDTPRGSIVN